MWVLVPKRAPSALVPPRHAQNINFAHSSHEFESEARWHFSLAVDYFYRTGIEGDSPPTKPLTVGRATLLVIRSGLLVIA